MNYVKNLNMFGIEAKEIPCIRDEGAPTETTEGAIGCLYMDENDGEIYKRVVGDDGEHTWENVLSPVDKQIGEVETALDSIIAIQNALIGGDTE